MTTTLKKSLSVLVAAGALTAGLSACSSKADVASKNLSTAADNFQVLRRVVLYNGITDKYIVEVDGYCSLGNDDPADRVTVTCKIGNGNDAGSTGRLGSPPTSTCVIVRVFGSI